MKTRFHVNKIIMWKHEIVYMYTKQFHVDKNMLFEHAIDCM
jgi:RNase P/RNase MRP subunit p30